MGGRPVAPRRDGSAMSAASPTSRSCPSTVTPSDPGTGCTPDALRRLRPKLRRLRRRLPAPGSGRRRRVRRLGRILPLGPSRRRPPRGRPVGDARRDRVRDPDHPLRSAHRAPPAAATMEGRRRGSHAPAALRRATHPWHRHGRALGLRTLRRTIRRGDPRPQARRRRPPAAAAFGRRERRPPRVPLPSLRNGPGQDGTADLGRRVLAPARARVRGRHRRWPLPQSSRHALRHRV